MTQQTAPKCWGMIVEWVQSDGMARMAMTGGAPTSLSVSMNLWAFVSLLLGDE